MKAGRKPQHRSHPIKIYIYLFPQRAPHSAYWIARGTSTVRCTVPSVAVTVIE